MSRALIDQRLVCPACRFRFVVQRPAAEDRCVEAECPSCDQAEYFTVAQAAEREPSLPDPKERECEVQHIAEVLWLPIDAHRHHAAVAWLDRAGNGVFEDDCSECAWPAPYCVYRFTRQGSAAYIWWNDDGWLVRGWHPLSGRIQAPEPAKVSTFEAALDWLVG
jgi:hypothetical protein